MIQTLNDGAEIGLEQCIVCVDERSLTTEPGTSHSLPAVESSWRTSGHSRHLDQ